MKPTARNANAFASTFYFFADTQRNAEKDKKSLQAIAPDSANIRASLTQLNHGGTEARTDNMGIAKMQADGSRVSAFVMLLGCIPSSTLSI